MRWSLTDQLETQEWADAVKPHRFGGEIEESCGDGIGIARSVPRGSTLKVEQLAAGVLDKHGVPADIGADGSAHLTLSERSGHASHGLSTHL